MSHRFHPGFVKAVFGACFLAGITATASAASSLLPVTSANFCVTLGTLYDSSGKRISVVDPQIRATLHRRTPQGIQANLTYWGRTARVVPLASGTIRQQFGFKLRAQDPCNLIYAMWRFQEKKLVVQVKSNPRNANQCAVRQQRLSHHPRPMRALPAVKRGDTHKLRASLNGAYLRVFLDNAPDPVWQGDLGAEAVALDGPVGIRSDNVKLDLYLFAPAPTDPNSPPFPCSAQGGGD